MSGNKHSEKPQQPAKQATGHHPKDIQRVTDMDIINILNNAPIRLDDKEKQRLIQIAYESFEFNFRLLENIPYGILVQNLDTSIKYVNSAVEKLTGYSKDEILDRKIPYPWWFKENYRYHQESFNKCLSHGGCHLERSFQRKNGTQFWAEITANVITFNNNMRYIISHFIDVTERKKMRDEMEFYVKEVTRIQEEERKRIARELHDDTAQSLACLALELDAIIHSNEAIPQNILHRLGSLKQQTDTALQEVRRFSHELRAGVLDLLGLIAALELLVDEMNSRSQIRVDFNVSGLERRLSAEEEQALFRIVQEALSNIRKHSQATNAEVNLVFCQNKVKLDVIDNGKGFPLTGASNAVAKGRLGLLGMKERAHLIGSTLSIKSAPNQGTTISIETSEQKGS